MLTIKSKILFLTVCLFEVAWLLAAQVIGSSAILIACLAFFLGLCVWAAVHGMVMPVLLFFLPFAPLLKLQPGANSFFTVALVAVYLVYLVLGSKNINVNHFIPALIIIAMALVVKTFNNYAVDDGFILFSASLLLIPFLTREADGKYDFYWLTLFFAIGIAIGALSAQYLSGYPTITRYIETHSLLGTLRRSGYYGDPNFYSAHITAVLGGVLVLLLTKLKKAKIVALIVTAMVMFYCGFMSVSKTFLLVTACLLLFWGVAIIFQRGKLSEKFMVILTFGVGVVFLLSSTVFTDLVDMFVSRFLMDNNMSDFTTRRTDLWKQYMDAFSEQPSLLIFGQGITRVLVNDRSSHNTIIQSVFQFGLVGIGFLAAWLVCFVRTLLAGVRTGAKHLTKIFILLMGAFGPWMALDLLFFDEFFLMPIYVCAAVRYLARNNEEEEELTDGFPVLR